MGTRKSMKFPIIIAFIFIVIIVSFFSFINQTEVSCVKTSDFNEIHLSEEITSEIDGKHISHLIVTKTIFLSPKYANNEAYLEEIKEALNRTLEYLGNKVKYSFLEDRIIVRIDVRKNEIILLDNIRFDASNNMAIQINSNTKSNEVIPLAIGDNYTDGEFMKFLKNSGYSCK